MSSSWIVSAKRTPIGRYLGELSHYAATQLGGHAISAAMACAAKSSGASEVGQIDEVIMGQVLAAGVGQAPARQASLSAGIPDTVGCGTVNKVCGSGLYAVMLADRAIRCGDHQVAIAGGMESMSQAPHLLKGGRAGWKYGSQPLVDSVEWDGLTCPHGQVLMGRYAEKVAIQFGVSRQDQDSWALSSHQRAVEASRAGKFKNELIELAGLKGQSVTQDGGPRADSSLESLSKLRPAFDSTGTVTAGNASSLSDGAAALVLASESKVKSWKPGLAFRIVATTVFAAHPSELFIAPAGAVEQLLQKAGCKIGDIDLFEINEAFASQTVACMNKLAIPPDKLNVHGGAIALGHPIGCSGARVLVTLIHALADRKAELGVASLCLGGGEAVAMLVRAESIGP